MFRQPVWAVGSYSSGPPAAGRFVLTWVANHKKFEDRLKLGAIAQLGDVSKGAACSKMATAKLGWVGEIVWAIAPNFGRCSKLLVVCHPDRLLGQLGDDVVGRALAQVDREPHGHLHRQLVELDPGGGGGGSRYDLVQRGAKKFLHV